MNQEKIKIKKLSKQILETTYISPIYTISKTYKPSLTALDSVKKELEWANQFCYASIKEDAACSQYYARKKSIVMVSLSSIPGATESDRLLNWKNMLVHEIAHNKFGRFRPLKITSVSLIVFLMALNVFNAIFLDYNLIYIADIALMVACLFSSIALKSLEEMVCESVSLIVSEIRGDGVLQSQLSYIHFYASNLTGIGWFNKKRAIEWALRTADPIAQDILAVKHLKPR